MYVRNQHNIVKQLSSIKLKKKFIYILTLPAYLFGAVSQNYLKCYLLGYILHFVPDETTQKKKKKREREKEKRKDRGNEI